MKRRTTLRGALLPTALVLCLAVVIAVVTACGGADPPAVTTTSGPADGKALYSANCVRCHGADLAGGVGPRISGGTEADLSGIQAQIKSGGTQMPAFGSRLTDEQIVAISAYVISVK